jgi:hypothetical protein
VGVCHPRARRLASDGAALRVRLVGPKR